MLRMAKFSRGKATLSWQIDRAEESPLLGPVHITFGYPAKCPCDLFILFQTDPSTDLQVFIEVSSMVKMISLSLSGKFPSGSVF